MRFIKKHKIFTILLILLSIYLYMDFTRIVETNTLVDRSSIQYINDLYASDGRIYTDYLDKSEKKIYMKILEYTKDYKTDFYLEASDYDSEDASVLSKKMYTVFDALIIDHPELMNQAGISWRYESETAPSIKVKLALAFSNKAKEYIGQLRIQRIISDIKLATARMNDAEKVKYVYEWIGDNARYDYTFMTFSKNQSIYNVFMKGNAVCAGFAKASQVIFQNIGIESYTLTGITSGRHMWNIVKVNGKYYYYDSTVSACRKKTSKGYYDGLIQKEFSSYSVERPDWYKGFKIETTEGIIK